MPYTLGGVTSSRSLVINTNDEQKSKEEMEKERIKKAAEEGRATERGTKIVKKGGELDKNSFLKILAAQMKNQDPTGQNNDPSAYVAQLAQFASLEQMQNLNQSTNILKANSMIGKGVSLKYGDENGNPITGIVRLCEEKNGQTTLGIEVQDKDGNAKIIPVDIADVSTVMQDNNYNMDNINVNTALMQATSMIGKNVVIEIPKEQDKTQEAEKSDDSKEIVKGKVTGVVKENGGIFINVELENGEIKKYPYNLVVKIEE